jgi:pilus assembly protein CpaF
VISVAEVIGLVDGEISIQEIFTFRQVGVTPDGRAVGFHSATGVQSIFKQHFLSNGVQMPDSMFAPTAQPSPEKLY